jgi:putative CocE/NonD family hydrolase
LTPHADMASLTLPGLPGVTLDLNVPCHMRDGVTLVADVYRPAEGGPFPVILMRLPYDKTQAETVFYGHPSWYARHGYLVVVQDCRGRWGSGGEWYPFRDEAADGYETIEWAARLQGANGRVGLYGASYAGATQLLAATLRPPSLVTICPAVTASQYYDGWTYNYGALALAFAASWTTDLGRDTARRRGDADAFVALNDAFANAISWYSHLPLKTYPPLVTDMTPYFRDWLDHPTYDDYWRRWSIDEDYGRITVPALHIAGWYDVFLSGSVKNFAGLRQSAGSEDGKRGQKLLIGPWMHFPWVPADGSDDSQASSPVVDDWQLRWFDQFLKGEAKGVLDAPVTIYVLGDNRWRDLDAWPPTGSRLTPYYLHSGGHANGLYGDGALSIQLPESEPPDTYAYNPSAATPSLGGHSCCFQAVAPMGPADQRPTESLNTVLVYTTPPLTDDVTLIGDASVTLYAASSVVDTDWTARLCQVDRAGLSTNIQEGIVRARYRDSLTSPSPIEPHGVYRYQIPLGPVGIRVPAGYRLRLTVSSSDFPQWDRNLNTGGPLFDEGPLAPVVATQLILHDADHPSCLTLPIMSEIP